MSKLYSQKYVVLVVILADITTTLLKGRKIIYFNSIFF